MVYSEGDKATGIYMIQEGNFEVSKDNPNRHKWKQKKISSPNDFELECLSELRLAWIGPNEMFGLEETYFKVIRRVTVKCCSGDNAFIYFLSKKDLIPFFKSQVTKEAIQKAGKREVDSIFSQATEGFYR